MKSKKDGKKSGTESLHVRSLTKADLALIKGEESKTEIALQEKKIRIPDRRSAEIPHQGLVPGKHVKRPDRITTGEMGKQESSERLA